MIREATASTFLVRRDGPQMEIALAWHPRLVGWLPAGGHVEDGETEAETALRETAEETGLRARLVPLPLPASFPHRVVPGPWWTVEVPVCPDNHTPVEHLHLDHVFVAEVDSHASGAIAECETWPLPETIGVAAAHNSCSGRPEVFFRRSQAGRYCPVSGMGDVNDAGR